MDHDYSVSWITEGGDPARGYDSDHEGWVIEDAGEWVADLDVRGGGYYFDVQDALEAAGYDTSNLTPVGPNVNGPTNPIQHSTRSPEWTF